MDLTQHGQCFHFGCLNDQSKSLHDGFSCFNHNQGQKEWIRCSAVLITQKEIDMVSGLKKKNTMIW